MAAALIPKMPSKSSKLVRGSLPTGQDPAPAAALGLKKAGLGPMLKHNNV